MTSPLYLIGIPVVVIGLAMVFGYWLPGYRRRQRLGNPLAIAPFVRAGVLPPRPVAPVAEEQPPQQDAPARAARAAEPPVEVPLPRETRAMDAIDMDARAAAQGAVAEQPRVLRLQVAGDSRPAEAPAASSIRRSKPADGTLQFLPGRLEVIEGRNVGQELRFVKTAGPDGQTVTFGRNEGPPYRHVQLEEHTVSRMHARMTLEGKVWTLTNLSKTNPASVNGLALSADTPSVVLRDGDRIELGEVVLRFRNR